MGNALGCSALGKRLVTAARDGDVGEAGKILELNPNLAGYSTFGGLSSALHAAAARGHAEIVMMLLENGADVNLRNFCGQTPLMHACRYGRWEVVQTLLLFRCNVSKVENLSGRTALHFAAAGGHARCIKLLAAAFVDDDPHGDIDSLKEDIEGHIPTSQKNAYDKFAFSRYVNKPANGGMTALHLAAMNGNSECVHLLLDLHADISAATVYYTSSTMSIGAGSTPLHYAASAGNLKCCQVLLARGANRSTINCNGWLPVDVARIWGCPWLVPLLSPHSSLIIPIFPPNHLSLPLISILKIAREHGLQSPATICDDYDLCAVCLERACSVAAEGCGHELCTRCALCLCSTSNTTSEMAAPPGSIPCPLCRSGILAFRRLPIVAVKELVNSNNTLCKRFNLDPHDQNLITAACMSEPSKNQSAVVPLELTNPTSCRSYAPTVIACTFEVNQCQSSRSGGQTHEQPSHHCQTGSTDMNSVKEQIIEKTSCSTSFRTESSSQRELQQNLEVNT